MAIEVPVTESESIGVVAMFEPPLISMIETKRLLIGH